MAKLSLTNAQKTTFIDPVDAYLESAMAEGTSCPADASLLAAMTGYSTLETSSKTAIKTTWKMVLAALIKVLGGTSVTINYMKSDGISTGTLTYVNGILTAST